ncbi:MAG: SCO family protein [Candidatus Krumholzibacteria bacterium]|nr:SCO family protein [Candidatus Krumholzibacteria bacterium]
MFRKILILSILSGVIVFGRSSSVRSQDHDPKDILEIGIEEKLGDFVPMQLGFLDASGDSVFLGDIVDKPTIMTLVYYHCPSVCKPLLGGIVEVVDKSDLKAGEDYNLLTISFDERDTPESATTIKTNFTNSLKKDIVQGGWRFLTADSVTIAHLTDAVGFRFKRDNEDFAHGTSLIVLSPDGKIVRYLYGMRFMPFDLKMAVTEATKGTVAPSIARVLQYCFSYDPAGRRYALNVTRVMGTGILLAALGWVVYLTSFGRRKGKKAA